MNNLSRNFINPVRLIDIKPATIELDFGGTFPVWVRKGLYIWCIGLESHGHHSAVNSIFCEERNSDIFAALKSSKSDWLARHGVDRSTILRWLCRGHAWRKVELSGCSLCLEQTKKDANLERRGVIADVVDFGNSKVKDRLSPVGALEEEL